MKKLSLLFMATLLASTMIFTGCGDDDTNPQPIVQVDTVIVEVTVPGDTVILNGDTIILKENDVVTTNITENTTWTNDRIHVLSSRVTVLSGVTLTIECGTIIKAQPGSGSNATALVVARGGKIDAQGTETCPIIFTSIADNISSGNIVEGGFGSPNLGSDQSGLWGGVIVLGNAPISADAASVQIEGIPPSDTNGLYGGSNATDNSGVLKYVSIRHGGANIGEGNEINGLTLGGVGSGTIIENVEVVGNQDDGIEWFGGTVNVTNALVWNAGDDAIDTDQEWAGTLDNFIIVQGPNSDHALELDGGEGTITNVKHTIRNGSVKGYIDEDTLGGEYADLRSALQCNLESIYFFNFGKNSDFELDNDGVAANYNSGAITIAGLKFNTSHLATGNTTAADIMNDQSTAGDAFNGLTTATAEIVTTKTGGADATVFGWTWASQAGGLASGF